MDIKVIEGNLVITLPLNAEGELSGSGKNFTVASTHGFQPVEGQPGYTLSLNLCKRNEKFVKPSKK